MGALLYSEQRAMVLAPHADDETLGCAGVIQQYIRHGSPVRIVIASFNLSDSKRYLKEEKGYGTYSGMTRITELKEAMRLLGVSDYHILYPDHTGKQLYDSRLDRIPRVELVSKLEHHFDDFRPTVLYIPSITKHQDHEALHLSALAATRPYFWNGTVLVYETDGELSFQPNLYVPLTEEAMNLKMKTLKAYQTQIGSLRHPVHPDSLLHKAKFRGNQIYEEYAEAFQVIRMHG